MDLLGRPPGEAWTGRQPSIAGTASPRVRGPSPRPTAIASRSVATSTTRARDVRRRARRGPVAGTIARRESEARGLAQPTLEAGDRAQLAEQPDLADGDRVRGDRPVAHRRGEGERDRQVEPRLGDAEAAGEVGVHVMRPDSPMPARRPSTATSRPSRLGSMPLALRAGVP